MINMYNQFSASCSPHSTISLAVETHPTEPARDLSVLQTLGYPARFRILMCHSGNVQSGSLRCRSDVDRAGRWRDVVMGLRSLVQAPTARDACRGMLCAKRRGGQYLRYTTLDNMQREFLARYVDAPH